MTIILNEKRSGLGQRKGRLRPDSQSILPVLLLEITIQLFNVYIKLNKKNQDVFKESKV